MGCCGVQRLGTIFQFLGTLKDPDGQPRDPLILTETKLLPELDGYSFTRSSATNRAFSSAQQLDFKRSRLDIQIILKESDPTTKYELFERLNTGGSIASDQEVRNCVLVWMNEPFFDWMHDKLAQNDDFSQCVFLPERLEEQQYRIELVLRFLVFYRMKETDLRGIQDLGEFLNEQNRALAVDKNFDRTHHRKVFAATFRVLNEAVGPDAFHKYDLKRDAFRGGFLISAFEAVALGVAYNIDRWASAKSPGKKLRSRVTSLWSQAQFVDHIGIGVAARERVKRSIPFGRRFFRP